MKDHYQYHANFTDQGRSASIVYPVQRLYDSLGGNMSMLQLYNIANTKEVREIIFSAEEKWFRNTFTEKELMWASWRNKTVRITNEAELPNAMKEGVALLLDNGYADLAEDILPFVSMLMEEQRYYHFDDSRIALFGNGVSGIVDIVEFFGILRTMDKTRHAGVCRDVQDAGLRMLRPILNEYYKRTNPELSFNPDDYLYLQSWVTGSGQHVTTTLIDPQDRKIQYELDWGKVVEKTNHFGYDNGRNYGTVFRMWKFDHEKNLSVPLTYAFTETGKLLNTHFFSKDDDFAFAGLRERSIFSEISAFYNKNKNYDISISAGLLSQGQSFASGTFRYFQKEKTWWNLIKFHAKAGLQLFLKEDHLRKNTFMLEENTAVLSLITQPRYQAHFSNIPLHLSRKVSVNFFINGTADFISLLFKSFGEKTGSFTQSGDAGLYVAQGLHFDFRTDAAQLIFLRLQNRSYLISKEIRLLAPNPVDFFSHSIFSSPGQNIIAGFKGKCSRGSFDALLNLDFEKQDCIYIQPEINFTWNLQHNLRIMSEFSAIRQLKGETFYWLPSEMLFAESGVLMAKQKLYLGLNYRNLSREFNSFGVSLRLGI